MSFSELSKKCHLPNSHLFGFLQIRHFIQNQNPKFPSGPLEYLVDSLLALDPEQKCLISSIYSLNNSTIDTPVSSPKDSWEQELGTTLPNEFYVHSSSICARHSLLQCRVVQKLHYANLRLSRIHPNVTDNRCEQSPANHSHIFKTLSTAYNTAVSPDPLLALFGTPLQPSTSKITQTLPLCSSTGNFFHPPSQGRWLKEMLLSIRLEKLSFSLIGSLKSFGPQSHKDPS